MPWGIYLCPLVLKPHRRFGNVLVPKYNQEGPDYEWSNRNFGTREGDLTLLWMSAPSTYLGTMNSDPTCIRLADANSIDKTLTAAQVTKARAWLENRGIPGQWIDTTDTRRHVIKRIMGMAYFSQRMQSRYGGSIKERLAARGVTLDTQWRDLPQGFKNELGDLRDEHGWRFDAFNAKSNTTLRDALKVAGEQYKAELLAFRNFDL